MLELLGLFDGAYSLVMTVINYVALIALLLLIGFVALLFKLGKVMSGDFKGVAEIILYIIVYFTIYLGMRRKRKWLIPFILISSAFGILRTCLGILSPADNVETLLEKFFGVFFFLFFGYQLMFFSNQSVKNYFGVKGRVIF